eukprot:1031736-Rhodomonas_salina.3
MSPHNNAATLDFKLHPTFNVSLLKPYVSRDPWLGPSAHSHPAPIYADATGECYFLQRIVAEKRRCDEPVYTFKWVGYPPSRNTTATHSFLVKEPSGELAIEAWPARRAAVPTTATRDRAARHIYRGPRAPAPPVVPSPVAPAPPPVAPAPSPAPLRSGRVPRPPPPRYSPDRGS